MNIRHQEYFITQKPSATFLQQYIAYYYFHQCTYQRFQNQYIFYPHYKNALSIYKNSTIDYNENTFRIEPSDSITYFYSYKGVQRQFSRVFQRAPFNKIGIVFQPLGINHFLGQPLAKINNLYGEQEEIYFGTALEACLDQVYQTRDCTQKVALLDAYFLKHYVGFREERLVETIDELLKSEHKYSVNALAQKMTLHRKTLLRLFQKHLNCSVKDYIDVVQFRKALQTYQEAAQKPLLTNLAHDSGYYDQSELIHHFKRLTGYNPKRIFQDLQLVGNEDTFWTLGATATTKVL